MASTQQYTALVLGATGATGSVLVHQLVKHNQFKHITAVTRNSIPNLTERFGLNTSDNNKLTQLVVNYDNLDNDTIKQINQHDVVFCTLGTTRADAGSADAFRHIDYGYVLNVAKVCDTNKVKHFVYQSSQGANADSSLLYSRTKGEVERDLVAQTQIPYITVLRPGLLLTNRPQLRFGEKLAQYVYPVISSIFPAKYKSVDTRSVAAAMIEQVLDTQRSDRFKLVTNGPIVHTQWATDAAWKP